ncbi:hypothetical protein D9757_008794 [Collybiopsis confluens]|uniref:Secreted protein n=1 Tax=Collybiopsis confluens TaxID=2823264 RepID=A0A8H5H5N7_9AGAR|nr:hypothetical protein D9757_008794 [Collybiopsis confluens]
MNFFSSLVTLICADLVLLAPVPQDISGPVGKVPSTLSSMLSSSAGTSGSADTNALAGLNLGDLGSLLVGVVPLNGLTKGLPLGAALPVWDGG